MCYLSPNIHPISPGSEAFHWYFFEILDCPDFKFLFLIVVVVALEVYVVDCRFVFVCFSE